MRLRATDAVTIVADLLQQVARGDVPGVPSAHVIRLTGAGALVVEGPVAAGGPAVSRAAQLLDALLPPFDATGELKVPGALRLVVARALGTLDLPPYSSAEEFAAALQRFAEPDPRAAIRRLVDLRHAAPLQAPVAPATPAFVPAVEEPVTRAVRPDDAAIAEQRRALMRRDPMTLSISDIRRARRATGLPLQEISERSRVPASLLRQLEWGYLRNWPGGLYGRTQLIRYARAAGLDEQLVIATVWPLLDAAEREREAAVPVPEITVEAVEVRPVPSVPVLATPVEPEMVHAEVLRGLSGTAVPAGGGGRTRRSAAVAAVLAVAALVTLVVIPRDETPDPASPAPASETVATGGAPELATAANNAEPPAAHVERPASTEPAPNRVADQPATPAPADAQRATDRSQAAGAGNAPPAAAEQVRGLTDAETAWSPAFASVGSAMFYHAQADRRGASDVVRADTDGEGTILRITRIVDDNAQNFHARPSPDGTKIAFDSNRDGERGVYVADADGTNVRRVSGEGFAAVPSWSPDGRALTFVRAEQGRPSVWNLWLLNLDSGEVRRLTSYKYGQPWGGSWFPDGRRLAHSHEDRLVVLDVESGRQRVYPSPRKGRLVRTPAVSPDGRKIIFQVHRDGAWLLDVADGSMRKVLADPTAEEYAWSPDGRRVAYHSRRSGNWGVWLMAGR